MNLITLGWPYANPTLEANPHELAKITGVFRNQYKGVNGLGQTLNLYLSGGFMMEASESSHYPATGDWVKISPPFTDEQNKSA
ncbi:hypothetical protein GW915_10600, partial [bacterium]|nr:hypothetical protein [bacterium]